MSEQTIEHGETMERTAPTDYFGFQATERFTFPDGQQFIEFSIMNEGAKARFQKLTTRDLVVQRGGDARMKMDPAQERHELIRQSVTSWNLYRGGNAVAFSDRSLKDFLDLANPKLIEDLEKAIRKANPWLMADMKSEDIEREIENLNEMLKVAQEREAGELSSSSR